jgi:hypothetical protein
MIIQVTTAVSDAALFCTKVPMFARQHLLPLPFSEWNHSSALKMETADSFSADLPHNAVPYPRRPSS